MAALPDWYTTAYTTSSSSNVLTYENLQRRVNEIVESHEEHAWGTFYPYPHKRKPASKKDKKKAFLKSIKPQLVKVA